jgi:hypothetical protein
VRRVVLVLCCLLVSGCSSTAPNAAASSRPNVTAPSVTAPSPSRSHPSAAELRDYVLVPADFQPPSRDWVGNYDKDLPNEAVYGCQDRSLTPHDLTIHQREWQRRGDSMSGAGEIVAVLPAADGSGPALVAAMAKDQQSCAHQTVNGATITRLPVAAVSPPALPSGATITSVYCDKDVYKGHPTTYSCFAAAGIADVYVQAYGFGRTQAQALELLTLLYAAATHQLFSVPR